MDEHEAPICPQFRVPCLRGCAAMCQATDPQLYGRDWRLGDPVREALNAVLAAPNPIFGVIASEPPCSCPDEAFSPQCSRHRGWDYRDVFSPGHQDGLGIWREEWPQAQALFTMAGMPEPLRDQMALAWVRTQVSLRRMAGGTAIPTPVMFGEDVVMYDDVLLAYGRAYPRNQISTGSYKIPRWYNRAWWRIRKYRAKHAVHQWIHDHLSEAHCDY